jgi:hypothetical protein
MGHDSSFKKMRMSALKQATKPCNTAFLVGFLHFFLVFSAKADSNSLHAMLKSLFPGADTISITNYWGSGSAETIYAPVSLRDRKGFIPLNRVKLAHLNDSLTALFFEIFLHDTKLSTTQLMSGMVEPPAGSLKLVQLVFYNRNTHRFVVKPEGFPLESSEWTCQGDICGTIAAESITAVNTIDPIAVAMYTRGLDRSYVQAFWLRPKGIIVASDIIRVGDLSGQTGCQIEISLGEYGVKNGALYATKTSVCDSACHELCSSSELPAGRNAKCVVIIPEEDSK